MAKDKEDKMGNSKVENDLFYLISRNGGDKLWVSENWNSIVQLYFNQAGIGLKPEASC